MKNSAVGNGGRPHIILILTDDQRYDTIRALGNAEIHTPNLDRLVARGTSFTHAHIPGGTSGAVCMPSRAMLHTGRTLFHLQDAGSEVPADHALLGETLRAAGYRTFGTGKWHNGPSAYQRSFSEGDEIFFGGMADHWNVPCFHYDATGKYDKHCRWIEDPMHSSETKSRWCDHIQAGCHSTDLISAATVRFIEAQSGDTPLFAYASFLAPHDPRSMPEEYRLRYNPQRLPLPPNFCGGHPFDNGELHVRDEMLAGFPRTPAEIRRHLAEYYAMITHLDDRIGDIVAAVERKGLLDQTLFVLAGDNGLALGQHGLMGKQSLYEHSTRVPLILAGPGIAAGVRQDALVYLLDVFPTLCALTGIPVPETVEGRNLLPVLSGAETGRDVLYLAYRGMQRGVRTDRHKLIEYVVEGTHTMTQLFDLEHDPAETRNIAHEAGHAALVESLRKEMFRLRDEWEDVTSPWGREFWDGYAAG